MLNRRIFATIAGLAALPIAIFIVTELLTPNHPVFVGVLATQAVYMFFLSSLVAAVIPFLLRFRLTTVKRNSEQVLSDLSYRLRISRFHVSRKPGQLIIVTSSIAAIKVKAKKTSEGTILAYQSYATPSGWSIILILIIITYTIPVALAISLLILYKSSTFASNRITPRLSQLPIPTLQKVEKDSRGMLIEGLSEGRRLSAEAYEAARSIYQDRILIIIIMGFAIFLAVLFLVGLYFPQDADIEAREYLLLVVGLASAVAYVIVTWRILASKTAPVLVELKSWKERLDRALSREIASEDPPYEEPSSFELMADSAKEVPKWMKIRRKAGMFRQPLTWLAIVFFAYIAIGLAISTVMNLDNEPSLAPWSAAGSMLFACLSLSTYLTWKRSQREEFDATAEEWARRHEKLMADMEDYLGSV